MNKIVVRCVACNKQLSQKDILIMKEDGTQEDLCRECLESIFEEEEFFTSGGKQWEEGRKVNRSALRGSGALAQVADNIIGIEGDLTEEETKNYRQIRFLKINYESVSEQQ